VRRFKRKKDDEDDIFTFDGLTEDEDESEDDDEEKPSRRRRQYAPPRPMRVTRFSDYDSGDDEGPSHEELEEKVRGGKYKPKPSDPWTIHVLYNLLHESGDIG